MRLVALLCLAAVAACTGRSSAAPLEVDLAEIADRTLAAGSAHLELVARLGGRVVIVGDGGFDTARPAKWLSFDMRSLPGAGDAVAAFVLDGDEMWVRVPEGGVRPWVHLDGLTGEPPVPEPADFVELLRSAEGEPKADGDGHLRTTVEVPDGLMPGADASSEPVPLDVWLDDDGRARRLAVLLPSPAGDLAVTIEFSALGDVVVPPIPPEQQTQEVQ